jgi:hypothetical protein
VRKQRGCRKSAAIFEFKLGGGCKNATGVGSGTAVCSTIASILRSEHRDHRRRGHTRCSATLPDHLTGRILTYALARGRNCLSTLRHSFLEAALWDEDDVGRGAAERMAIRRDLAVIFHGCVDEAGAFQSLS